MRLLLTLLFILFVSATYAQTEARDTTQQVADTGITREAAFPGGDKAWAQFVRDIVAKNIRELMLDNQSGVCKLKFVINEDGSIGEVMALTMPDSRLAKISIKAIRKGPKWIPAMKNGIPVKAYRWQPITFTIK